ncbi:MAG TPA: hypothetical protein VEA81_17160 [Burkholderiaceae bacterium]|nr:hypothetical protein [Burkholderiaceae bacterium]
MIPTRLFLIPALALACAACSSPLLSGSTGFPGAGGTVGLGGAPDAGPGSGRAATGPATAQAGRGSADPAAMCASYRDMLAGRGAAEREAVMTARMRSMHGGDVDPRQARAHLDMIERQCGVPPATR